MAVTRLPEKENFLTLLISLTALWDKRPQWTDTEMEAHRWQSWWFLSQSLLKMEPGINPGREAPGSCLEHAAEGRTPLKDTRGWRTLLGLLELRGLFWQNPVSQLYSSLWRPRFIEFPLKFAQINPIFTLYYTFTFHVLRYLSQPQYKIINGKIQK